MGTIDLANSKHHQQLNEILFFLPTLYPGNQQFSSQENSVMQYAQKTWCNPVQSACTCYNWTQLNNFADLLDVQAKNADFIRYLEVATRDATDNRISG